MNHDPVRCVQHAQIVRSTYLILGLMRHIHEQIAGQVWPDQATDFGQKQHSAARALDILPITTAGEILGICLPPDLLCRDCRRELEKTLRITIISLTRLVETGHQKNFFATLEMCM